MNDYCNVSYNKFLIIKHIYVEEFLNNIGNTTTVEGRGKSMKQYERNSTFSLVLLLDSNYFAFCLSSNEKMRLQSELYCAST